MVEVDLLSTEPCIPSPGYMDTGMYIAYADGRINSVYRQVHGVVYLNMLRGAGNVGAIAFKAEGEHATTTCAVFFSLFVYKYSSRACAPQQ